MPTHDNADSSSIVIDPARAEAAYQALEPELKHIPVATLEAVRIDVQLAASFAFGLAERDRAEERATELAKLVDASVLAPHPLERLEQAALAAWHARRMQLRFLKRGTTVPVPVAEQATDTKARMLKLIDYAFGDDSRFSARITAVHSGHGYEDMANDLQELADLYEEDVIAPVITNDPINYRDTDVADARRLAGEIFKALGLTSDGEKWTGHVQRAYTHLTDVYTEHCYAGSLLFFRREDVSRTYPPSLISVVRSPANRNRDGSTGSGTGTDAVAADQTGSTAKGNGAANDGAGAAGGQSAPEPAGGGTGDANPSGDTSANG